MKRFWPSSLFAQTALIILLGLLFSQSIGAWIYSNDRVETIRAIGGLSAAQRAANTARLLEESPPDNRERMVELLSEPTFRVSLSMVEPSPVSSLTEAEHALNDFLANSLNLDNENDVRVNLTGEAMMPMGTGRGMHGMGYGYRRNMRLWRTLSIAIHLSDGRWLSVTAGIPDQTPGRSWWFIISLAGMGLVVLIASLIAIRRIVSPLYLLGNAVQRFGHDVGMPPLEETGPREMRQAVGAFNRMREDINRLIDNRSRLLAAVSHDLRTPLTLLRLRTEDVEDPDNRERMLATIATMESMVTQTLEFARQTGQIEARRPTDLAALLASITDDMADAGLPVSVISTETVICSIQVATIRRALTNLIDNAVKYGTSARLGLTADTTAAIISIDDNGPGIPESEQKHVFEPFYRIEGSRNSETGGVGLGLSIAQSIIQGHGGQISLTNRPEGGLRVTIRLPH